MGHGDEVGYIHLKKCDKCGRNWLADTDENMKNRGWARKWYWRKFRFIWICPICDESPYKV